jgi:hypothetical protein
MYVLCDTHDNLVGISSTKPGIAALYTKVTVDKLSRGEDGGHFVVWCPIESIFDISQHARVKLTDADFTLEQLGELQSTRTKYLFSVSIPSEDQLMVKPHSYLVTRKRREAEFRNRLNIKNT